MDEIRRILTNLQYRLENIEKGLVVKKITIPSDGYLVIKTLATDPTTPQANEIWINTTTNQLKWYNGTTTKAVTLS